MAKDPANEHKSTPTVRNDGATTQARDKANALWAGVESSPALVELGKRIEDAAVGLGFVAEPKPFHPHVTLGRLRETRAIRDIVLPMSEQMFSETRADFVSLYESEVKTNSSVHKEISRIDLNRTVSPSSATEKRQTGAVELGDETQDTDDGWPRGEPTSR